MGYRAESLSARAAAKVWGDGRLEAGFDPVYGARPLKRAIQNEIENPLARAILAGKYPPKSAIVVDVKDGDIVFA